VPQKNTSEITIVTTIDTVRITDTVYVPKFRTVRTIDTVKLATAADTNRILNEYRELRVYNDTLRNRNFIVFLTDTLCANQIIARSWHGESYERTTTIRVQEPVKNNRWRYGVGAGGLYSQGVYTPAVVISTECRHFGVFGVIRTAAIGAGVSIRF